MSHQIRRLEGQLGKRLFVRRSRSFVLTCEAQDYLPAIRRGRVDDRLAPQPAIPTARTGLQGHHRPPYPIAHPQQ
jgi:DNA-binding transcriptional LysR family regulator